MRMEIAPQKGPQTEFLRSMADVCIYGGSAGGGKSYGLLLDPLRYLTTVPGFSGVIFRRTYPEIVLPGGLWDTSVELYKDLGAIPRRGTLDWTFPPYGNTISFHHLQHEVNKYQWQGSQVTYFGFDELTHFSESAFTYIAFSRGRSQCEIKSYVRGSCNPDPGWVKSFLAPWVDREYPRVARSGEVRWFIREEGKIRWVDRDTPDAKSMSFVRASVFDNPIMLARNPGYVANLKALLPVERARLLDGDWDVRRDGFGYTGFKTVLWSPSVEICRHQLAESTLVFLIHSPRYGVISTMTRVMDTGGEVCETMHDTGSRGIDPTRCEVLVRPCGAGITIRIDTCGSRMSPMPAYTCPRCGRGEAESNSAWDRFGICADCIRAIEDRTQ